MSTDVKRVVLSHISACVRNGHHAKWCVTHEAMMRGDGMECTVMHDALDLAEAVAEAVRTPHYSRTKEYALRLNCVKNGCNPLHAEDGDIVPINGWRWQEKWESSVLVGHACDQMTRTVYLGLWEKEGE